MQKGQLKHKTIC